MESACLRRQKSSGGADHDSGKTFAQQPQMEVGREMTVWDIQITNVLILRKIILTMKQKSCSLDVNMLACFKQMYG